MDSDFHMSFINHWMNEVKFIHPEVYPISESSKETLVSTVLNRNIKEYGSQHLFDNNDETCWSSDQGSPQWIEIQFKENDSVEISSFDIQFQGGFVGKDCHVEVSAPNCSEISKYPFYPEDINNLQTFNLVPNKSSSPVKGTNFRFVFSSSTDFFGRIVIYKMVWK